MNPDMDLPWTVPAVPDIAVEYIEKYRMWRAHAEGCQAISHNKSDAENMVIGMIEAKLAREQGI